MKFYLYILGSIRITKYTEEILVIPVTYVFKQLHRNISVVIYQFLYILSADEVEWCANNPRIRVR